MIQAAYEQRGLCRSCIKNDEDVCIQENAQQTDQEEKDIHRRLKPPLQDENCQEKEAYQGEYGGNAVVCHCRCCVGNSLSLFRISLDP